MQLFGRRLNEQKGWRKLDTDHQHGQYYEHCSRSIVPREFKEKQRCLPWAGSFFSVAVTRRSTLLGGKKRTNGSNMGEPIRTRKGKLTGRGKHDTRLADCHAPTFCSRHTVLPRPTLLPHNTLLPVLRFCPFVPPYSLAPPYTLTRSSPLSCPTFSP